MSCLKVDVVDVMQMQELFSFCREQQPLPEDATASVNDAKVRHLIVERGRTRM